MKKEDISGIIVYLGIIALAVVFGMTVLQTHAKESTITGFGYVMYIIGSVLGGALINGVMFEMAHVLGAKVGKYNVISVNIFGVCFYKSEGKRKVKLASYDGLTGETRIVPKEGMVDKANPYPFLFFGSLFFAVEAIVVMILFSVLTANREEKALLDVAYSLLTIGAIGLVILIYHHPIED